MLKIVWEQGVPCELPDRLDPFKTVIFGKRDCLLLGSLKLTKSNLSSSKYKTIKIIAEEFLRYILLERNQDLSELTITGYITTGNWILKHLEQYELDETALKDFKPITKIFQKIAAETRTDRRNRSSESKSNNKATLERLRLVSKFLIYLFVDYGDEITDHLHVGGIKESIAEPPSDFCVIESVRQVAKITKQEEVLSNKYLSELAAKTHKTDVDILTFFENTKNYRSSFLYLFIAVTGINGMNATLILLDDFKDDDIIKTSGKTISTYKARANKVVFCEITRDFIKEFVAPYLFIFDKYNSICDQNGVNAKMDYIGRMTFLNDGEYRHIVQYRYFSDWFRVVRRDLALHVASKMKKNGICDDNIKIPTPRDLRNYKQVAIETKKGHIIASIIMQHSEETAYKHYTRRLQAESIENLGEFYERMESFILDMREKVNRRLTIIPAGKCNATDKEMEVIELRNSPKAYVNADCTTPTGCLFCSHFVVHADEEGIYKLLSMREYIREKSKFSQYHSEFEKNYGVILERIREILDYLTVELKDKAIAWIEESEKRIESNIHPFWQELNNIDMALFEISQ